MSKLNVHVLGDGTLASAIKIGYENQPSGVRLVDTPHNADVIWCAADVELGIDNEPDSVSVIEALDEVLNHVSHHCTVILSSQLPVGTCAFLEQRHPQLEFLVVPENIRARHNIQDWMHQPRIVVGTRYGAGSDVIPPLPLKLFANFTKKIIIMSPESAEMVKHALNGFLACSIAYINEVAYISRLYGADPKDVAEGLRSDPRIGEQAYLHPGAPYSSGHLEREVQNLIGLSRDTAPLIRAIQQSNNAWTDISSVEQHT